MRPVAHSRGERPVTLRGAGTSCRVRPWANEPHVAQVIVYSQTRQPGPGDMRRWLDTLTTMGYSAVRTGALGPAQLAAVDGLGFECIQELALLQHTAPRAVVRHDLHATRRLEADEVAAASALDRRAFDEPWGLDAVGIGDVCAATARHRARIIGAHAAPVAYAISGRDARTGFLQRLAVDPAQRRHGHGLALVDDSLRWFARWRIGRVLVNTHVDNDAALELYARTGFTRLPERLRVFERTLT